MASKAKDIGVRDSFDMKVIVKMITVGGVKHGRIVVESDHFEIEWINSKTLRMAKARNTTELSQQPQIQHYGEENIGIHVLLDCLQYHVLSDCTVVQSNLEREEEM